MKLRSGHTYRIAASEPTTFEVAGSVRAVPKFGDPIDLDPQDGKVELPAEIQVPNIVSLEWDEGSAIAEVVERHYFSLDALRSFGDGQDDFDEESEERLFACRQAATEVFEQNANRSFVHRVGSTKDWGQNSLVWLDHNDVYEILTDGYQQVSDCQLTRLPGLPVSPAPAVVEYLFGADMMPSVVSSAVLQLAAYTLRPSNRPLGATGESSDAGYIHFTIAGRDGATAIPEVNAVIEQFGRGPRYVM